MILQVPHTPPKLNSSPLKLLPGPNRKVYSLPTIILKRGYVKLWGCSIYIEMPCVSLRIIQRQDMATPIRTITITSKHNQFYNATSWWVHPPLKNTRKSNWITLSPQVGVKIRKNSSNIFQAIRPDSKSHLAEALHQVHLEEVAT